MRLDSSDSAKYPWSVGVYGMRDHGFREDTFALGPASFFSHGLVRGLAIAATGVAANSTNAQILAALQTCVANANCTAYAKPGVPRVALMPTRANIDGLDVLNFTKKLFWLFK